MMILKIQRVQKQVLQYRMFWNRQEDEGVDLVGYGRRRDCQHLIAVSAYSARSTQQVTIDKRTTV